MGKPLDETTLREIRRHVGLVFQDPDDQLFCPTVFEDVAFGPLNLSISPQEIPCRVESALRNVGLEQAIRNRPSHHLSHGERKRVALASVLIMEPDILALDEPSSNLDPRNRRHLIELRDRIGGVNDVSSVIEVGQVWRMRDHLKAGRPLIVVVDGGRTM